MPEKLVVYTNRMVEEAIKIVGMKREDVFMAGPPQFDRYYKKSETTREQFLKGLGISPEKRVVLAAPFFDRYTGSAVVMINGLLDAIKTGKLPKDIQILVRYRPGTPPIAEGLLKKSENLTITVPCEVHFDGRGRLSTTEDFEWRKEDVDLLMNSLRWSDVVINTVSTLSVDASVYDKPVINVRFDAEPSCPPMHSVMVMLPNHDHYKAIEASGGVKLVGSMDEMISAINAYLKNPKLDAEGREIAQLASEVGDPRRRVVALEELARHRLEADHGRRQPVLAGQRPQSRDQRLMAAMQAIEVADRHHAAAMSRREVVQSADQLHGRGRVRERRGL